MKIIPQEKIYLFLQRSSFLYEIAERAARRSDKIIKEVLVMRNENMPKMDEAEESALKIMGGHIAAQILGRRKKLTLESLDLG